MKQFKRLIIPYFIWAIVILVIPLFLIALYAFTTEGNEVMTLSFTWGNFAKFLEATYLNPSGWDFSPPLSVWCLAIPLP